MKNLDSKRQSKMFRLFLKFYHLEEKNILMQTLLESQYSTTQYAFLVVTSCSYNQYYYNCFLKLFFFRYSYQMLLLHCQSCQITEKQQWILHLEYTKQIQMPKILDRKSTYKGKYRIYKNVRRLFRISLVFCVWCSRKCYNPIIIEKDWIFPIHQQQNITNSQWVSTIY